MLEFVIRIVVYLIVEVIFLKIILGILDLLNIIGIVTIKLFTFDKSKIIQLKEKYDKNPFPYLIGLSVMIAIGYVVNEIWIK